MDSMTEEQKLAGLLEHNKDLIKGFQKQLDKTTETLENWNLNPLDAIDDELDHEEKKTLRAHRDLSETLRKLENQLRVLTDSSTTTAEKLAKYKTLLG